MLSKVSRTQKDLLFAIHVLKISAEVSGELWQAIFISKKIAAWLEEQGCEVWPSEPAQYQSQTGERKYYVIYDSPRPDTVSMELYHKALQCREKELALQEFIY